MSDSTASPISLRTSSLLGQMSLRHRVALQRLVEEVDVHAPGQRVGHAQRR